MFYQKDIMFEPKKIKLCMCTSLNLFSMVIFFLISQNKIYFYKQNIEPNTTSVKTKHLWFTKVTMSIEEKKKQSYMPKPQYNRELSHHI